MDVNRQSQQRRKRLRDPVDRRVDKWIETGRQFVDGVSGARPGRRRPFNIDRASTSNLETVGRWVGDKLDWLLEDEDDWMEPWQSQSHDRKSLSESAGLSIKRPLEAVSRRIPQAITPSGKEDQKGNLADEWPEESSFRLERWQRRKVDDKPDSSSSLDVPRKPLRQERRRLPRSSRRRN